MALPSPKDIHHYLPMSNITSDHLRSLNKGHLSSENTSEQAKYYFMQQDLESGNNI